MNQFIVYTYQPGADPLCHAFGFPDEASATTWSQQWLLAHAGATVMVLPVETPGLQGS